MIKRIILMTLCVMFLTGCSFGGAANSAAPLAPVEVIASDGDMARDMTQAGGKLSSFTTNFNENKKNRAHNIRLASSAIDGVILQPGQEFSFNGAVGSTSKANGYKIATVFFNKEETKGYGGGVCQVSTTLFNAAEMAGLEITERHTHSLDVAYIEKGRDATTSQKGKLDLKFKNPFDFPVVLRVWSEGGVLTAEIYVL